MFASLVVTLGFVVQAAAIPKAAPVRVWRDDSIAYVSLRQPGRVLLLHVDAIGRIEVLYPLIPQDTFALSSGAPIAVDLPPTAQANPATFLAVWSRWPFEYGDFRVGSSWNYDAWLLQPTAGDPLAALLDIADRVTNGRAYEFAEATYSRTGTVVARGPVQQPDVCLSCYRRVPPVAAAASVATNSVDCSNASLTNSFCGVNSGSVSIATAPAPAAQVVYQPAPAVAPVYVPYFIPMAHGFRHRFEQPPPPVPVAPRSQGVAYPIAPRLVAPSLFIRHH